VHHREALRITRDLGLRETSNDDATHSGQSATQFVPERLPRNP
jgi:hypothetical protein